jgi:hypothetical protein
MTKFNCSGIQDINYSSWPFPTKVTTPDGGTYTIQYEVTPGNSSARTGRISQLTLPSGGYITYAYSDTTGNNGINCTTGVVPTLKRTVYDNNGNSGTWIYVNSSTTNTVTVTDPGHNQTVYNFAGEFQTQAAYYQGSATGTPLKIVLTCWNNNFTNCATPSSVPTLPITKQDVYTNFNSTNVGAGNVMQTTFDCANGAPCYGLPIQIIKDDWGQALVSTENLTYAGCGVSTALYIFDKPCSDTVLNSTGTQVAQTNITYTPTGDPSTISKWVSGTKYLTTNLWYNTNGTLSQVRDPNTAIAKLFHGSHQHDEQRRHYL